MHVLTPLDFFLWGHVKNNVYADAPSVNSGTQREDSCRYRRNRPQMFENVMENFMKRALVVIRFINVRLYVKYICDEKYN